MKKLLTLIFLLSCVSLTAQTIVWESEYECFEPLTAAHCKVIKDSQGNYISFFNDVLPPITSINFIKFGAKGSFIKYDTIIKDYSVIPGSFYETGNGYRAFYGVNNNFFTLCNNMFPCVVDFDYEGNILDGYIPYGTVVNGPYPDNVFDLSPIYSRVISIGNNFYVVYENSKIKFSETSAKGGYHFIVISYDCIGNVVWRNGYDTTVIFNYYVSDVKKSNDNNIIIYGYEYKTSQTNTSLIIIEIDTNGNKVKEFRYPHEDKEFYSRSIVGTDDGGYILMGGYSSDDGGGKFCWKIDKDGNIIKKRDIPDKNMADENYKIALLPDGGIISYGQTTYYGRNTTGLGDDSCRFYIYKLNSELETVWEYEWYNHIYQDLSQIENVYILDENNIIISGFKDRYKFYIAQFNTNKTEVKEQAVTTVNVTVTPQPFRDICEVTVENASGLNLSADIYDALGNRVRSLCNEQALSDRKSFLFNGSNFAPGVYYIEVRTGKEVIRKKILKVE